MRRLRVFAIAAAAMLAIGGPSAAWAGHYSATFTGTVTDLEFNGFCNTSDFSSQCGVSGMCYCLTLQGRATGSLIGRTAKDGVTINITYDHGAPQVGWAGEAQCGPIYASAHIQGNRDVEELDFTGSMCMIVDVSFKPQSAPLAGNWGLTDKSGIRQGFGTVTGAINLSNFNAKQS